MCYSLETLRSILMLMADGPSFSYEKLGPSAIGLRFGSTALQNYEILTIKDSLSVVRPCGIVDCA